MNEAEHPQVAGWCPMGCGMTLVLPGDEEAGEGNVTCAHPKCPRPSAVHELLQERETEHVVIVGEDTFSLQHPLRERLDGELFDCPAHRWLKAQDGPPVEPGRYRMVDEGDPAAGYYFEPIE